MNTYTPRHAHPFKWGNEIALTRTNQALYGRQPEGKHQK